MGCSISKSLLVMRSKERRHEEMDGSMSLPSRDYGAGYITAIFSASYICRQRNAQSRMPSMERDDDGKKPFVISKSVGRNNMSGNSSPKVGDSSVALAQASKKSTVVSPERELSVATSLMESKPEIINTWELMQGLDDEDQSINICAADQVSESVAMQESPAIAADDHGLHAPESTMRALLFKYVFNDTCSDDQHSSSTTHGTDSSPCHESFVDFAGDGLAVFTASFTDDDFSSPSSPELSPRNSQLSFKDWLPHSGPLKQSDDTRSAARCSFLGAFENSLIRAVDLPLIQQRECHESPCLEISNGGTVADRLLANAWEKALRCHELKNVSREIPVCDSEFLEAWERARERLCEEEWFSMRRTKGTNDTDPMHILKAKIREKANRAAALTGNNNISEDHLRYSQSVHGSHHNQFISAMKSPIRYNRREFRRDGDDDSVVFYSTSWQSRVPCLGVKLLA